MNDLDNLDHIIDEIDNLDNIQQSDVEISNVLYIGTKSMFNKINKKLKNIDEIKFQYKETVIDAVQLLLTDIYAIVMIERVKDFDSITASRVVRVNHPLARIIIVSPVKNSTYISNLINNGSVDGFLHFKKCTKKNIINLITTHLARHEINKMIVKYISDPPKLSKASYLLLDPTLSFGSENSLVKYTGIMITYESVPRYSYFFEDLLTKDEILFSGYLSGITILGRQLFANDKPMKEINFGGISVILRFVDDYQFFFFVRNLNSQNVEVAEKLIDKTVRQIMDELKQELKKSRTLNEEALMKMSSILQEFQDSNDFTVNIVPDLIQYNEYIMIYGSDKSSQEKMKAFLERKYNFSVYSTDSREECKEELKKNNYDILLLDSHLEDTSAIDFAEYAKEIIPHLQIIYRIQDMRSSNPLIEALNSTYINYLTKYKVPFKKLAGIIHSALKKAIEIKQETKLGMQSSQNQALIAKSLIRGNEDKYLSESVPELHGIFITYEDRLIYRYQPHRDNLIQYDQELLVGLVSSLKTIGEEALGIDTFGGIELGGANVLVQHREDFHFGFLVKNLAKNTSVVLLKDVKEHTNNFYRILKRYKKVQDRNPRLAKQADSFNSFCEEKFGY